MHKDVRELLKDLQHLGLWWERAGGNHVKVWGEGLGPVIIPTTPSDHRWLQNTLRNLRAAGMIDKDYRNIGDGKRIAKRRKKKKE